MTYYDQVYKDIKSGNVLEQEIELIKTLAEGEKILDVGCGTGRHLIPLIKQKYKVSGLEPSYEMLKALVNNLYKNDIKYKNDYNQIIINSASVIYKSKIQEFRVNETFDLIILMWNALNEIAKSQEELLKLCKKLKSLLNSKGKILINIDDVTKINLPKIDHKLISEENNFIYRQQWIVEQFDSEKKITKSREVIKKFDLDDKLIDTEENIVLQKWWSLQEIKKLASSLKIKILIHKIHSNEELYITLT